MCPYTRVSYTCGHCRYTVRAWCEEYEKTHIRCAVRVVALERRRHTCGDCKPSADAPWMDALRLPLSIQRRRSRSWHRHPPRPVWGCT